MKYRITPNHEYYGFPATTVGFVICYICVLLIDFIELSFAIRTLKHQDYEAIDESNSLFSNEK